MTRLFACCTGFILVASLAFADGPADNVPENVRRVPAVGIEVSAADRALIEKGLGELGEAIGKLKEKKDRRTAELIPDVLIYHKAVGDALKYREFFAPVDVTRAKGLLKNGLDRAGQLLEGKAPWTEQTGLVVRGYMSKIDDSVQPFGLVIPPNYTNRTAGKYRLDFWFHGRGEVLSEVNFLHERQTSVGTIALTDTIVLHPYGRYCNANKFAGEIDSLEALEAAKRMYRVDDDRISVRGFSMGGASVWQFAVHYPDLWFAANPGAGFSETPRFLKVFQRETLKPTWFEQKLWNMYDCDKWAINLAGLPTVAYSGELDSQKQAADVMAEALAKHNITLTHVIGPKTKHAYHPVSKAEVDAKLAVLAVKGRERTPKAIDFVTYTLRYNKSHWVTIDAIDEHWSEASVSARIDGAMVFVQPEHVSAFTLSFGPGDSPYRPGTGTTVVQIREQSVAGPPVNSDGSWSVHIKKSGKEWVAVDAALTGSVKRHGLQGPIDDAFLSRFLFVLPTGQSKHPKLNAWVKSESEHAIEHWRRHFRGEARVKKDVDVTDADIADSNLVLWGDSESNQLIKKVAGKLPIAWTGESITAGDRTYPSAENALIAIAPNPLNPEKYVVLNSGFTFREYDYLNNARQVPKLPDWAIVDLNSKPNARFPGKIVAADFFDEAWKFKRSPEAK